MKLLLWLVVGAILVLWLVRGKKPAPPGSARRQPPAAGPDAELIVQCAHCGIHIPVSEAVQDPAGMLFCSDAHRLLHAPR